MVKGFWRKYDKMHRTETHISDKRKKHLFSLSESRCFLVYVLSKILLHEYFLHGSLSVLVGVLDDVDTLDE